MNNKIKVAVLGCTGYTGLELIYLLSNHSDVLINFLGSSSNKGKKISSFDKRLKNIKFPKIDNINEINYIDYNVVFLALPHNISKNIIKDNFNKSIFIGFFLEQPIISKSEVINNIFVFMMLVLWLSSEENNLQKITIINTKPH